MSPRADSVLVADLLVLHRAHEPEHHLPAVVGDGVMLATSEVCRRVRQAVIDLGGTFSASPPYPYYALPLIALQHIYATRIVPYVPNVPALEEVERRRRRATTTKDLGALAFRRNFVLHESSHLLFQHLVPNGPEPFDGFTPGESAILRSVMVESFADSVEVLVASEVDPRDTVLTEVLHLNGNHRERVGAETRAARELLGRERAFRLFIAASMTAQLLAREADDEAVDERLEHLLELGRLTRDERSLCRRAFRSALDMDARFRLQTIPTYLRLEGHDGDAFTMLDFDSAEVLRHPSITAAIGRAAAFFEE